MAVFFSFLQRTPSGRFWQLSYLLSFVGKCDAFSAFFALFIISRYEAIIITSHIFQIFDKNGNFKYAFGTPGKEEGHLWKPRKVAVLKESGNFVICDRGNERSRMQIFSPFGHFVRRIAIRFVDIVAGLAISREGHIVVVDSVTPTIFIINENGGLIRHIECSQFMTEPSDIAVFRDEFYICDFKGHSVVVMHESGAFVVKSCYLWDVMNHAAISVLGYLLT